MKLQILPFHITPTFSCEYDACIVAIGYESRSRFFYNKYPVTSRLKSGLVFSEQHVLDFDTNFKFFKKEGFSCEQAELSTIKALINKIFEAGPTCGRDSLRVLVDISSMTRQLISAISFFLMENALTFKMEARADFVYSIAKFGEIPSKYGPIVSNGPSIRQLAGWSPNASLPCGVVLGIGYEQDLALGLIEDLEASRVWAFRPCGHHHNYDLAIDKSNVGLFDEIPRNNQTLYSVHDPYTLFAALETLFGLNKRDIRLIVAPFGPKIFTLASSLAALMHYPEIGIWRVSGGTNQEPVDRVAAGSIPALSAIFKY